MPYSPDTVTINVDLPDIQDYPVLDSVGTVYDVAINGVGYMLLNDPTRDQKYRRGTVNLDPERLATTETPLDESINRYTFASIGEFSGGAGQKWLNRPDSDGTGFHVSKGVDVFTEAPNAKLLNSVSVKTDADTTYSMPRLAVVGPRLFMQIGDAALSHYNGVSWTDLTGITDGVGAVTISDLTSDGNYWYAACGDCVVRGTTSNPAAKWATVSVVNAEWAAGRLCVAVKDGSSATPNQFATLGPDGIDEQGAGVGHLTLDEGHTILLGGVASGHFYFASYAGTQSQVWAWKLGLDQAGGFYAPFVAWDMPPGLQVTGVFATSDTVFIAASDGVDSRLYRAIPGGDGNLTPFFVTDFDDVAHVEFTAWDNLVFWTWPTMNTYSGVGAYSLKTGGYSTWYEGASTNDPVGVAVYDGELYFSVAGVGAYSPDSTYVSSGTLTMSIADGSSGLDKVWDEITLTTLVMPSGGSVQAQLSVDNGNSFTAFGTFATAGTTKRSFPVSKKSQSAQLHVVLAGGGTVTPTLTGASLRYHPLGLTDRVLVLPIDCADNLVGLNGRPIPAAPGSGAAAARALEGLSQTRVQVQDVDYADTGLVELFELVSAESEAVTMRDPHRNVTAIRMVTTVTLRKPK